MNSKKRMQNSNEDLPLNMREALSSEIEQSLESLRMKRNQVNLDTANNQLLEYDSRAQNIKQREENSLISLNDIPSNGSQENTAPNTQR